MPGDGLLLLMAAPLAVAAVVLAVRGARPRDLARLRLHGPALLWVAAAFQAVRARDPAWAAPVLDAHGGRAATLTLWSLGAGFVALNAIRHRGAARAAFVLLGVGFTLNSLATVVNDGMPYSVDAGRLAGMSEAALASGAPGHVPADDSTRLPLLGDVLPVPGARAVASVGDVLLGLGVTGTVVALVSPAGRRGARPGTPTPGPAPVRPVPTPERR